MNSEDFRTGLDQIITRAVHLEEDQGMDKSIKVGQDIIQIIVVIAETIWEVIKVMGDKFIIEMDSGETLEIKAMREIGVGHVIGSLEIITEWTIEASVTVDQGQVLEQVPIETELDVLSVKSMIILHETAPQHKQTER